MLGLPLPVHVVGDQLADVGAYVRPGQPEHVPQALSLILDVLAQLGCEGDGHLW